MNKAMKQGFTLIELMVVVIIVGILAAVAIPKMKSNVGKARSTEAQSIVAAINTAALLFATEDLTTVPTVASLQTAGYLDAADLAGKFFVAADFADANVTVGRTGVTAVSITTKDLDGDGTADSLTYNGTKWTYVRG